MATKKITINNTSYPIKFGYGAIRILGIYLKQASYDETVKEVNRMLEILATAEKEGKQIPFDISDGLGYVVKAGLEFANPDAEDFDVDELCQAYLLDLEILKTTFEAFMDAMPKPKAPVEPVGKRKAQAKPRVKKK